ncbi:MAG TPA: M36 family metallopeptidase, partial [Polyangium sp.]|nr:M36 family metallopeptidase [Polyangium sp.]
AADDGRLLERKSLTKEAAFNYRVWSDNAPTYTPPDGPLNDFTPHPTGVADNSYPMFNTTPPLVTVDGFNTNPMMTFDSWLPAGATTTVGNNVDAYVDLDATDGFSGTDFRASTTSAGTFDRVYNTAQAPTGNAQRQASITQLFFDNNYYHDFWYDSGFNEAAGNAQAVNFGRGGVEGDVLLAEAQDSSGTDNANMSTPADGDSPRMQMYVFTAGGGVTIARDGAIDNGIVGHEWGHYLHMRNTTGGNQQYGAMSEGWGDFQALMQVLRSNDNFGGTFATGIYASKKFQDSGYYGIRRFPYSTNFQKNALTFRHIGNGVALPLPTTSPFAGNANSEVHNAGEVWCSMLWESYANLLEDTVVAMPRHTYVQAKRKMANYVVGGLKMAPFDPTITEQRDGIIAATIAGGVTADVTDIQDGFATRGAGPCAVGPARTSTTLTGVVEDFTNNKAKANFVSLKLTEGTPTCDNDGIVDVGEGGGVTINVQNTGWAALTGATVSVTTTNGNITFPSGNSAALPTTASLATSSVTIPISVGAAITTATYIPFSVTINSPNSCTATTTGTGAGEVMYDVTQPNSPTGVTTETFEGIQTWTAKVNGGGATNYWGVVRPAVPTPVGINETAWGQDIPGASDHVLESPDLVIGATALSVTFQHRYDFEFDGTRWDGGVIEYSEDGGMTWADVSTLGVATGYNGTITATNPVLGGRMGYTSATANFATGVMNNRTLTFPATFTNRTIRIRFRIGTDEAVGAGGWYIDNLAFTGLTNKPFSAQVVHNCSVGTCGNGAINAGEQCDDGNTANGDCCSSTCQFEAATTVCRAATGACDVAESCTGTSATCPADNKAPNGTACSDSNACTQMDSCQAGACVGANPVTCAASDQCHVAGTCNPTTGTCSNPNAPNGTTCNDNNACTQTDSCQTGVCTGANPVTCAASDQCHVAGTCNPT